MTGRSFQADFARAVREPDRPLPGGLTDSRRFAVYRNTHAVTLAEALAQGFPVVAALVGAEFFSALAGAYRMAHPPRSPLLRLYGRAFPDFIAGFPPAAALPYLADVARLEWALLDSAEAADARALPPASLAALPPDRLYAARLVLAPAVRLLSSAHPVLSIWRAHQPGGAAPGPRPGPAPGAERILITRPAFDPTPAALSNASFAALRMLASGATVGEAARHGDLTEVFTLLLDGGAITGIS